MRYVWEGYQQRRTPRRHRRHGGTGAGNHGGCCTILLTGRSPGIRQGLNPATDQPPPQAYATRPMVWTALHRTAAPTSRRPGPAA